jgi:uncharacterized membrane protein YjgN (DUF898 family)
MALTHYQILRVPKHASLDEIESAYRVCLGEVRAGLRRGAPLQHRLLDKLREARRVLGNAESRAAYDLARGQAGGATAAKSKPASRSQTPLRFSFTGCGSGYFGIWIANVVLTLLTLGIYSPWAKVRREQYFYRHTRVAGSSFAYHGDPLALLKERLLALGLLLPPGVALAASFFLPEYRLPAYAVAASALIALMPWLMLRSVRFHAASSSYRELRFAHRGTYGSALIALAGGGLLLLPTLGAWTPMWIRAVKRFQIGGLCVGDREISCTPAAVGFLRAFLIAGLLLVVAIMGAGAAVVMNSPATGGELPVPWLVPGALAFILAVTVLLVWPWLKVHLANLTWNATTVGNRRLRSTQAFVSFWPLYLANLVLLVATLGLYWPWAQVRLAAYQARHLALEAISLATVPRNRK